MTPDTEPGLPSRPAAAPGPASDPPPAAIPPQLPAAGAAGAAAASADGALDGSLLAAALASLPMAVGVFDTDLRYRSANTALCRLVGVPANELLGRRIDEVLPGVGAAAAPLMRSVLATGHPVLGQPLVGQIPASGSRERTFEVSYVALTGPEGTPTGVASVVVDVTAAAAAARAEASLALLSTASEMLSGDLDLGHTLARVADLLVPRLGDHCVLDLLPLDAPAVAVGSRAGGPLGHGPTFERVAVVHAPGLGDAATAWAPVGTELRYPPAHPVRRALAAAAPQLDQFGPLDDVEAADRIAASAPTRNSAAQTIALGLSSVLTVPLVARGTVVGVASLVMSRSGRVHDSADLEMVRELAVRAAVAIDNARTFTREQQTALTLQRSLLPGAIPTVDGLEARAVYRPGSAPQGGPAVVGGDWYDVIPLPSGRIGLVIGDVMGRGLRAAALMGQLRAAVRAYAVQDLPPPELLGLLDSMVATLDTEVLVTCLYGVFDPGVGAVCLASAGHLAPLLLRAGEPAVEVGLAPGAPLGAGGYAGLGGQPQQTEVTLNPGDTLLLYTDGLVETPGADLGDGLQRLAHAAVPVPDSLSELLERVLSATGRDGGTWADDVAALAVRGRALDPRDLVELALPSDPASVATARRVVDRALAGWERAELRDPALLVVSELVTNAQRHGAGEVRLRLRRSGRRVLLEVSDGDTRLPRPRHASPFDEGGRGLALVDALCRHWGARATPAGKVVWCDLS